MARPKIDPHLRRTHKIEVPLNQQEYDAIRSMSEESGMDMANYIRWELRMGQIRADTVRELKQQVEDLRALLASRP